jgi:hypothetical protein
MLTFTFPFYKADTATRRADEKGRRPGLADAITKAREFLGEHMPGRALSVIAPWLDGDISLKEVRLIAGRSLFELGRYPEAFGHLDRYLSECPKSLEGLVVGGLSAARIRDIARAMDFFSRASQLLNSRQFSLFETLSREGKPDLVALEEMLSDVEADPGDIDRALALSCALGISGHFRAVERFTWVFDRVREEVAV